MNIPYIKIILVLMAILFVPLIPSDDAYSCTYVEGQEVCNDEVGYISVYTKYFSK